MAAATAASSSSSSAASPQAEVMPHSASSRYREGTRVLLTSGTRRGANESYVWLKADVHRTEETSKGSMLYMREVGGREEFKQVVPYTTNAPINTNPQPPGVWDVSTKAPDRLGDGPDGPLPTLFSFLTPCEVSAIFAPPRPTALLFDPDAFFFRITTAASNEDTAANGSLPAAPSVSFLSVGSSLSSTSLGEGSLSSAAASSDGAASSLLTFAAAIPVPKPPTRVSFNAPSAAPSPLSTTTAPTPTAPVDRSRDSSQTQSANLVAPAKGACTAQPTTTPASGPLGSGNAPTGEGGDPFGAGAASGGGSPLGGVGSTGSPFSGTGIGIGRGIDSKFGGRIFGGTGVAASSQFSRESLSTSDSPFGEAAFAQQSSGGAAPSSPSAIRTAALQQQTHITIDNSTDAEDQFWDSMTPEEAFQLGKRLVNLTAITLVQPERDELWCLDSMISIVEGHAGGRREAREKEGQQHMAEGSLESIEFIIIPIDYRHIYDCYVRHGSIPRARPSGRRWRSPRRPKIHLRRPCPPPSSPQIEPLTLPALRTITGAVQQHSVLADTGWKMPALERVLISGWDGAELGRFISTSVSLQEVGGSLPGRRWAQWATVFEHVPMAPPEQPGPLRKLHSIGVIHHDYWGSAIGLQWYQEGMTRLEAALTSRGYRKTLKSLNLEIPPSVDHSTLPTLLTVDSLVDKCCVPHEVDITVLPASETMRPWERLSGYFELSVFHADNLSRSLSPFIKKAMQEAARGASKVKYTISQHEITHPGDSPSQAAVEIAETLTFDKARFVTVANADGFAPPPGTPAPTPTIIDHLQPFPAAKALEVRSALGGAAGSLLAEKMPREVNEVVFGSAVGAEDKNGMLEALGSEREVHMVYVGPAGVGYTDGWRGWESLPVMHQIDIHFAVSDGMGTRDAAKRICDGVSSIVSSVRGLERVIVSASRRSIRNAILKLLPDSSSSTFTIYVGVGTNAVSEPPKATRHHQAVAELPTD
ncbi:unnamed protein product [Vitrella brassicaformis CCMP3155]|uniref:Uncharacterized protein n=3 Tax=Vitrella brassicaformis TaxID=1169539 RepID=A0A0G4EVI4_VITBC|nr:unnamed protein product [Vitrella brassicaformis CCMP3155]|eukprot:CEM02090.1 unnamed protein product [Vitrella brassicaformis CCMP3155]